MLTLLVLWLLIEVPANGAPQIQDGADCNTLNQDGLASYRQGQYPEAMQKFQAALTCIQQTEDRVGVAAVLNNIGLVQWAQGRYEQALESYEQALVIVRQEYHRAGEGAVLNGIGAVYVKQGRYAEALGMYQQALAIRREMGDSLDEANTLSNLASLYTALNRYDEALGFYRQALDILHSVDYPFGEGTVLRGIADIYRVQQRESDALEHYQQALTIAREINNRPLEGIILNDIGTIHYSQDRFSEALESYQQALAIDQEVGDRFEEGTTHNNIGLVHHVQGNFEEALAHYEQALVIAREVGDLVGEGIALFNIAILHQALEHTEEASDAYQQAMDILETVRATAGSHQARASFVARYADLYARGAGFFHQQGQDEEAFFVSERGRARAFLDSLATGQVVLTDDEAIALLEREQEVYAKHWEAVDALAHARALDLPDPALVTDLEAQLDEAKTAYATVLADIEARGDQLATLVPGQSPVLALSDVQALLNEQTTLLSYFIVGDQTLAFLITPQSFEVVDIHASYQDLFEKVMGLRVSINEPEAAQQWSHQLYQLLITPILDFIHTPRLAIVPHGPLHYLPFAALQAPDTGQYLIERYTLVTLPSASALPFLQENTVGKSDSLLILGNPDTYDPDIPPLLFAEQEAKTVATIYGVQPLLGQAATESALREKISQTGNLLLAAHGAYNPVVPLHSTIFLAPDDIHDGQLQVREVYGLDLSHTDLVVLSACQTQLGQLSAGDELVGLTRAFFFAGTPSVIATLWSVDDEVTGLLIERFYTHLQGGMSKAAALRQAQLEMIEDYPDPYYWSGFVLSGDGGVGMEVPPDQTQIPNKPWTSPILGSVLLVVLAGVGLATIRYWSRNKQTKRMLKESKETNTKPSTLADAIQSIRAGDKESGRYQLVQVIQANPRNEMAWLWMTEVVDSDEERSECLQFVLEINPNNVTAKRGLVLLQQKQIHRSDQMITAQVEVQAKLPEPIPASNATTVRSQSSQDTLSVSKVNEAKRKTPSFLSSIRSPRTIVAGVIAIGIMLAVLIGAIYVWRSFFSNDQSTEATVITQETAPSPTDSPVPAHPGWTSYTNANRVVDMAFDHEGNLWAIGNGGVVKWSLDDGTYTQYTVSDGLVHNFVLSIAVAPDGVLWFGTSEGGVSRFDGRTWTSYTTDDGLVNNSVQSIAIAPDGALWFGTYDGVSRLDPTLPAKATKTWTTYTTYDGLVENNVQAIAVALDGTLWFGTNGGGVSHFDGRTWTTYNEDDGLANNYVETIAVAPDGALWFGTSRGVSRLYDETWTTYTTDDGLVSNRVQSIAVTSDNTFWFAAYDGVSCFDGTIWKTYDANNGLADNYVTSIAIAPDSTLWFGTHNGITRFGSENWITYTTDDGLVDDKVTSIAVASDGALWFGTDGSGVSRFDGDTWTTYTVEDGLANDYVRSIAVAPDGTVWFATFGGVSRFDGHTWAIYTEDDGLADNNVQAIAVTSDGALWFGTDGGVSHFDSEVWTTYTEDDGLVSNNVQAIAVASDGALWFGTSSLCYGCGGVSRFDPALPGNAAETWTTYTEEDGLVRNEVHSIATAPDGALWFSTDGGVSRFDGKTWTTYTYHNGDLAGQSVHSIAVAPDGALWFGTYNGVSRFDGKTWITYRDGLARNDIGLIIVEAIAVIADGTLWFGTDGAGVSRFNGEPMHTYTTDGLVDNNVRAIAVAPDGALWFGTSRLNDGRSNVSRFDGEAWTIYTEDDGLAYIDFGASPITMAPDGALWFGTSGGVSCFDDETWTTYTTDDGLADNHVLSIAVAPDGALWFGTTDGVSRFDGATWMTYAASYVGSIIVASDGALWFGTIEGAMRFDGETWTTYTTDDGLASNYVRSIAAAPDGALWFGTWDNGITHFDGETWTTYTTDDGLTSNFVGPIAVAPDGALWVGTLDFPRDSEGNGVSCFDGEIWHGSF